ncbi:MAG: hypothetical protein WA989_02325, partial [Henriciella sp.]|uniref:hypothetical protein n=1 Tax=Henriciella sp. TaxID=1968823 RepID=UPI003C74636A
GRPVRNHGPGDSTSEYLSSARAHRRLGHDYDLPGANCVHFVRASRGRKPTPIQVARATFEAFRDMVSGAGRRR